MQPNLSPRPVPSWDLVGCAAPFSEPAQVGSQRVAFAPGAFDSAIARGWTSLRVNHGDLFRNGALATQAAHTLQLWERDDVGLCLAARFPDQRIRTSLAAHYEEDRFTGFSVSWRGATSHRVDNYDLITRVGELLEVSLMFVELPAFRTTAYWLAGHCATCDAPMDVNVYMAEIYAEHRMLPPNRCTSCRRSGRGLNL